MKIILSRKGFDSSYGGSSSVILPDNHTMISFPITSITEDENKEYNGNVLLSDLNYGGYNYQDLLRELNQNKKSDWEKFIVPRKCHLDPDLREDVAKNRKLEGKKWRAAFGQCGGALTQLKNNKVEIGDVFIYFGLFQNTKKTENGIEYVGREKHVMFGYLQIGEIVANKDIKNVCPWHPHACGNYDDKNCLFIASEKLTVDKKEVKDQFGNVIPGYGVFNYCEDLVLTKEGLSKSRWDKDKMFPDIENTHISCHPKDKIKEDYFQSVPQGQEFVIYNEIDNNKQVIEWAINLIKKGLEGQ